MTRKEIRCGLGSVLVVLLAACGGDGGSLRAKAPEEGSKSGGTDSGSVADRKLSPAEVCAKVDAAPVSLGGADKLEREASVDLGHSRDLAKPGDDKRYTMTDMRALEAKESWLEILSHAEDIAPTSRDAAYEALIVKAATRFLKQLRSMGDKYEAFGFAEGVVRVFPKVAENAEFMKERAAAAKPAFEDCLSGDWGLDSCLESMNAFLKVGTADPGTAFELGKLVRSKMFAYNAVPFFKAGLAKDAPGSKCSDEDLKLAVIAGLGLPPDYDNAKLAREIASGSCFESLKSAMVTELTDSGYYAENTCGILKAKGAL